jgi:DNA mismatch repair protein MutL
MGVISILDDRLANMIAAGEVVERPASVVKELVENAIDAGSSRIEVHLEEGGLRLIRVRDNGSGIEREDCALAFERHATSKIKRERDLFHISTLGFRGEALPSIAAVSRLELLSSEQDGQTGTRINIEGGNHLGVEAISCPKGTEIVVRDLFYNTPARLKYLKSIQTETGHIADYLNRLAFAFPSISFLLTNEGRTLLKTYGDGNLLHVIAAVYGTAVAKEMLPIEGENLDFGLVGFIGNPQMTRANRSYLSFLVNGRYIRSQSLTNAVLRGYHTLLPINRFPLGVLQLKMDPSLVDVNVHPAKLEVRFSKEQELIQFLEIGVKKLWQARRLIPQASGFIPQQKSVQERLNWDISSVPVLNVSQVSEPRENFSNLVSPDEKTAHVYTPEVEFEPSQVEEVQPLETVKYEDEPAVIGPGMPKVPELYPLAQFHGTYIIAQSEEGLYLIDQHAAQERLKYEYFMKKLSEEKIEKQELLFPITIELSVSEMKQIEEKLHLLSEVGIELESFGNRSFLVRSHPRWFVAGEAETIIQEMIEMVLKGNNKIDVPRIREKAAIMMSCKASIKANRHLNHLEMEELLNSLRKADTPYTCPHGRPIIIHFSTYEIEKMFKRVM